MRVAICHYHLQRGGVTRIIHHTIRALLDRGIKVVAIAGEAPPNSWAMPHATVPALHYDNITGGTNTDTLYSRLTEAAHEALGAEPDIWHFHNHSLGKNLSLPGVINRLAHQGQRLLLHIHDFPEDGRPLNYSRQLKELADGDPSRLSTLLYPAAPHVHYALLNRRDMGFMRDAGAEPDTLHLLANPVEMETSGNREPTSDHASPYSSRNRLWLYPTRAIRRKNVGEFLLWAAVSSAGRQDRDTFALTMAPQNPAERPFYQGWKAVASELSLPVEFEYAQKANLAFSEMLQRAHAVTTTSVAEGFGMAFLEPWLMSRPVCGRDLPEITQEFREVGIGLPYMYTNLRVPVKLIGQDALYRRIQEVQTAYLQAYSFKPGKNPLPNLAEAWIQDGMIDFGRMDEKFQARIIRHVNTHPESLSEICPDRLPVIDEQAQATIETNKRLIKGHFNLETYAIQVLDVYTSLKQAAVRRPDSLDGNKLLQNFLSPQRLSMLRMAL